MTEEVTVIVDG